MSLATLAKILLYKSVQLYEYKNKAKDNQTELLTKIMIN